MLRKLVAVFMVAVLTLCVVSCVDNGTIDVVETHTNIATTTTMSLGTGQLHLAYNPNDSLDPYSAKSKLNRQLTSLLFDPLVKLDSDLNPQLCIARSVKVSDKHCYVDLKDIRFTDGTSLTATDVIDSFSLASKNQTDVYYSQLQNVNECYSSGNTVVFTLKKDDANFINLLDFPIIKSGSRDRKNSDKKVLPPIGCGRYVFDYSEGNYYFNPNKSYYGSAPKNSISLFRVPDDESWKYSVLSGETDVYYSGDDTTNLPSFSGGTSVVRHTDFVFLSISDQSSIMQNTFLRKAINSVINRKQITESAFYTYAYPSTSPYPNTVEFAKAVATGLSPTGNVDIALDFMSQAGYTKKNEQGYYLDKDGKQLTIRLLSNTKYKEHTVTAELISQNLRKIGIYVENTSLDNNSYRARMQSNDYDMYVGEIKLNKNFDLTSVLNVGAIKNITTTSSSKSKEDDETETQKQQPTTKAQTNNMILKKVQDSYNKYLSGSMEISEFAKVYFDNLPFIPICHRTGVTGYSASVSPKALSSVSDAYINLQYLMVK